VVWKATNALQRIPVSLEPPGPVFPCVQHSRQMYWLAPKGVTVGRAAPLGKDVVGICHRNELLVPGGIVRPQVRMICLGQLPICAFDLCRLGLLWHAQYLARPLLQQQWLQDLLLKVLIVVRNGGISPVRGMPERLIHAVIPMSRISVAGRPKPASLLAGAISPSLLKHDFVLHQVNGPHSGLERF
jgi:hypothetical protein